MNHDPERARVLVDHGCITAKEACRGKVQYPNRNDARHAAKELSRRWERKATAYKCPFCECWHLTKWRHGEEEGAA